MNPTSETPQGGQPLEPSVAANPQQGDNPVVSNNGKSILGRLGGFFGINNNSNTEQGTSFDASPTASPVPDSSSGLPPSDINAFASRLNDNQAPSSEPMGEPQVVTMGSSPDTSLGTPSPVESHPDQPAVDIGGNSGQENSVSQSSLGGNDTPMQATEEQPHVEGLALDRTGVGVSGTEPAIRQETEPLSPDLSLDNSAVHIPGAEVGENAEENKPADTEVPASEAPTASIDTSSLNIGVGAQNEEAKSEPEVVGSLDNEKVSEIRKRFEAAKKIMEEIGDILGPEVDSQTGNNVNGQIPVGVSPIAETKV